MGLGSRLGAAAREVHLLPKQSGGRSRRPNPWPKCVCCMHRVPELCIECGWCRPCCLGHDEED